MISDVAVANNDGGKSSMDDFIKKIFVACDKDEDGYLDRLVHFVVISEEGVSVEPPPLSFKIHLYFSNFQSTPLFSGIFFN